MEEKNNILKEKKKLIIILIIVLLLLIGMITTIVILKKNKKDNEVIPITTASSKKVNIFKGFKVVELDLSKNITYDVKKNYEIIYANNDEVKTIYTSKSNKYYEITLKDGILVFKEGIYNTVKEAYDFSSKKYELKLDEKIVDYLVAGTCEQDIYSIVLKDEKNNVYLFNTPEEEFNINDVLNSFENIKTISKVSKIGYYNESNNPNNECANYELVYLDTNKNVRFLTGKNAIFYDTAYYRYIGKQGYDNFVYVLKDGLMKYDIGDNKTYLNNGNHNIKYMGSFYNIENSIFNLYIIGTDGYLYVINDLKEDSKVVLTKINNSRVKKIGTRTITNEKGFATEKSKLLVEFVNEETFSLDEILGFELLN